MAIVHLLDARKLATSFKQTIKMVGHLTNVVSSNDHSFLNDCSFFQLLTKDELHCFFQNGSMFLVFQVDGRV